MKAIILAAGRGARMRPLTDTTPKPLLKVAGKTFLDHIFDALPVSVNEVIVVVDYLADQIQEYLGGAYKGRKIIYEQGSQEGNAIGFLRSAKHFGDHERFLVVYGDEIPTREEVDKCLQHEFSWLCCHTETPQYSGIASMSDEGLITEVVEKPLHPKSQWAACGVFITSADIFALQPEAHSSKEVFVSSLMSQFCKTHAVYAVMTGMCRSFTSPEDLERVGRQIT